MSRRDSSAALSRSSGFGGGPPLIGLAHGSRHAGVADGIESLLAKVTFQTGIATYPAYLDLTDPDLDAVAATLAAAGEHTAVVVPLLFTEAFHARIDVPAAVERAAAASGVQLIVAPVLGTDDDVLDVVEQRLVAAGTEPDEPVLVYAVGSSRADANTAVAELAERLSARRNAPVSVGFGTTDPRAADGLAELGPGTGTVVPLFVAPGLLLDAVAPTIAAAGWRLADPLGTLLAPLVSQRYDSVARTH
ncbi:MAG: sirohydrochlorin chelatase [Microlunatus sp.]